MASEVGLKDSRKKCYEARDIFLECFEYKNFEKNCPVSWVDHFIRKYKFEKYKEELVKEGFEIADEKNKKNKILNKNVINMPIFKYYYHTSIIKNNLLLQSLQRNNIDFWKNDSKKQFTQFVFNRNYSNQNHFEKHDIKEKTKKMVDFEDSYIIKLHSFCSRVENEINKSSLLFCHDPYEDFENFTNFYKITKDHVDGTFNTDNYIENVLSKNGQFVSPSLDFFMEINCPKDIENILDSLFSCPSIHWNGGMLYNFLKGISYMKYNFQMSKEKFEKFYDFLEKKVQLAPIKETKQDLQALYQGLLCDMGDEIKEKFKLNVWNDRHLLEYIFRNPNKKDGPGFLLKSLLYLNRPLSRYEFFVPKHLKSLLKDTCNITKEKVSNEGFTQCGEKLLPYPSLSDEDVYHLLKIFNNFLKKIESSFRNGYTKTTLINYFEKLLEYKKNYFTNDRSKRYAAVIDGLNFVHNEDNSTLLFEICSSLKKHFSNVVFITRHLGNQNVYLTLKKLGVIYLNLPKDSNDDLFIITTGLLLGKDAYIISNDLYRDSERGIMPTYEDKVLFRRWLDTRNIRWSLRSGSLKLPPKYLRIPQGNFKNLESYKIHIPVYFERRTNHLFPHEDWYCLTNK
ncbi:Hypothetical protein SRAE_1000279400 [Strongyloides ratti]|uniref:PRORP domain-containing protein n=1 Tax=Strongyloides ratti TaxID=34506 RepID=A0A090LAH4_STRRB|nr:Hypothetical protein SRAE_1000279400 [Strongyloides ratti]CEF64540.1 Hypothetical protein SRAE_1000279400 [Strongyloides ratti]